MKNYDLVEHKDKTSTSGYPHNKIYQIYNIEARMKDFTTGKWYDAVIYINGNEVFIREKEDFLDKFKVVENENNKV